MPSLNDIISSNKEINPNQVTYQKVTTTDSNQPEANGIEEGEKIPQETIEIKGQYKKERGENSRYEQTMEIQEEPESTTKIVKRVIQAEQPKIERRYYEKE